MTVQLTEGQDVAHFTLIERTGANDKSDTWVALDRDVNQRVFLTVFHGPLGADVVEQTRTRIERTRGLIHQHILRIYEFGQTGETCFLSQQYVKDARPLNLTDASFRQVWPTLQTLMNTMVFAHELGFAHGQLHLSNLLIDPTGELYIRDFGLPAGLIVTPDARSLQSPDHGKSGSADPADDIYALGCLVYRSLTGNGWPTAGQVFESSVPVPDEVRAATDSMLRPSAYDRARDLNHIREVLSGYASLDNGTDIMPTSFARTPGEQAPLPRAAPTAHQPARERQQISTTLAVTAFVVVLGLAAIVFLLLPDRVISPSGTVNAPQAIPAAPSATAAAPSSAAPVEPELAPMEIAQIELARENGKVAASAIIRLQVELEDVGVSLWARDRFEALSEQAISGDQHYREGAFARALEVYEAAITGLRELQASVPSVLAETVTEGDRALAAGEAQAALRSFAIATAIDSEDPVLAQKLARAESLAEVLTLVGDAEQAEREADLVLALEKLQAAVTLDPEWPPATLGLERVRLAIRERNFDDAMSAGFSALAQKKYDEARNAFVEASGIIPASTESEDGLLQIELALRMDKIEAMKTEAEAYRRDGEWKSAVDAYQKILEVDDALVFARQGLDAASERLALDTELQKYIDNPTLLQEDKALGEARGVLVKASRLTSSHSRLTEQINRLSFLISAARVPVNVTITSDDRTDVTIYRVAALGRLSSTRLDLYPGRYTIVGKRRGYRDVQQELLVLPGTQPQPVDISCVEKI